MHLSLWTGVRLAAEPIRTETDGAVSSAAHQTVFVFCLFLTINSLYVCLQWTNRLWSVLGPNIFETGYTAALRDRGAGAGAGGSGPARPGFVSDSDTLRSV